MHIVKNYTGDVLNFKLAAEDAADEGIKVTSVVIDDDVAVQDSLYTAGRRGVGATVLAEKIAGAAAETGGDLAKVTDAVKHVNDRARTFGVALSSCIPPANGKAIFDLPEGEIEFGIGIHGEPGRRRAKLGRASEVVDVMVEAVLSDLKAKHGAKVLVFVNGMGGTPLLELYLIYGEVDKKLRKAGLEPVRNLVGSYITSLEMAGASLTVLELNDELIRLWDTPVHTAALTSWMHEIDSSVRAERDHLVQLDAAIGDGDHGTNMVRGFEAVVQALDADTGSPPGRLLIVAGRTLVSTVGGASGPLWGSALRSGGRVLGDETTFDGAQLAEVLAAALASVKDLGTASLGDKTMVDALEPAVETLRSRIAAGEAVAQAVDEAAAAAEAGMRSTIPLQARKGRASYLGERSVGHQDPGATSTALILRALQRAVTPKQ